MTERTAVSGLVTSRHALLGSRWVCVDAGSSLLVDGATYTVVDVLVDGATLVEMDRLRGFLFGLWRFQRIDR